MNLNSKPSVKALCHLHTLCDDHSSDHILWVNESGEVFLERLPNDQTEIDFAKSKTDLRLRYETATQGAGYVGPEAANDVTFMNSLLNSLIKEWPEAKKKKTATYIGEF